MLIRKIIFYIFVISYIIFCPLILLYAFGYIFRPHMERGIIKTGLISLSTVPSGATIYVENRHYANKTPTVIRDLIPSDYSIEVKLKDYKSWARTVSVSAGRATVLDKIILTPKIWKPKILMAGKFLDLLPVAGTHFFMVTRGQELKDYFIYDSKTDIARPILKSGSDFADFKVISYFTVKESPFLFFHIKSGMQDKFLRVELKDNSINIDDISRFFSKQPMNIKWDRLDPDNIFILENDYLNRLNLSTGIFSSKYIENVKGFGLYDRMIYVLRDKILLRMDYEKRKQEILHDDSRATISIFGQKGYFDIEAISKDIILFLGERGELFTNLLPYKFVDKGVQGVDFNSLAKRLIFWQKERLGLLDFSIEKVEDEIFQSPPNLLWLLNGGKNIKQGFWVYKGSHILFLDNDKVYLFGIKGDLGKNPDYLFEVKKKSVIFYSEETGKLYYLDPTTGNLSYVKIIPEKEIF